MAATSRRLETPLTGVLEPRGVMSVREEKLWQMEQFEIKERFYDFLDKWKAGFILIPAFLFSAVIVYVLWNFMGFGGGVERGYPNACDIEVVFEGEFTDGEKRRVNEGVSDRLCDHFEVDRLLISRVESGVLEVEVDVPDWFLEYRFVQKAYNWRIKKYARTLVSNKESGEVS